MRLSGESGLRLGARLGNVYLGLKTSILKAVVAAGHADHEHLHAVARAVRPHVDHALLDFAAAAAGTGEQTAAAYVIARADGREHHKDRAGIHIQRASVENRQVLHDIVQRSVGWRAHAERLHRVHRGQHRQVVQRWIDGSLGVTAEVLFIPEAQLSVALVPIFGVEPFEALGLTNLPAELLDAAG